MNAASHRTRELRVVGGARLLPSASPPRFTGGAQELVQGIRANDPDAQAAFVQRYAARVQRIITRVLGFDAERADVLQEVFVAALTSIHTLKEPSAVEAWLSSVAALTTRRVIRSRARRSWLRGFIDASEERRCQPVCPAFDVDARSALRTVDALLWTLPARERSAFALRFIEGMEVSEIAAATGASISTVRRRLVRAERCLAMGANAYPELKRWVRRRGE